MKCPYCSTIVNAGQKRCPICNADLSICEPDPCDVIPDENGHCNIHDDYNVHDEHNAHNDYNVYDNYNVNDDNAPTEQYSYGMPEMTAEQQEFINRHPVIKEALETNPKYRELVQRKLQKAKEEEEQAQKRNPGAETAALALVSFCLFIVLVFAAFFSSIPFPILVILYIGANVYMQFKVRRRK